MYFIDQKGYWRFHNKDGTLGYAHRKAAENKMGKSIPKGYVVHHINEIKRDNQYENLAVIPDEIHRKLHKLKSTAEKMKLVKKWDISQ